MPTPKAPLTPGRLLMSAEYLEIRRDDHGVYWLLARRRIKGHVHVFQEPLRPEVATELTCTLFAPADGE